MAWGSLRWQQNSATCCATSRTCRIVRRLNSCDAAKNVIVVRTGSGGEQAAHDSILVTTCIRGSVRPSRRVQTCVDLWTIATSDLSSCSALTKNVRISAMLGSLLSLVQVDLIVSRCRDLCSERLSHTWRVPCCVIMGSSVVPQAVRRGSDNGRVMLS